MHYTVVVVNTVAALLISVSDAFLMDPTWNVSAKQCPFHQVLVSSEQCVCHGGARYPYDCDNMLLPIGYCMTYNKSENRVFTSLCPYEQDFSGNVSLDAKQFALNFSAMKSGHEVNEAMCGHLNREGLLCGKCKPGYGTAVYSKGFKCVKCNGDHMMWMWVLYLVLEIVPLTALYLAIIIFNIRATSPPFTSFLFHSQLFSLLNTISVYKILMSYEANNTLYHFTMTVLDIWNLDALRHLIPLFCVSSSLSNFQVQLIRLTSAVYPLVLVVVSYVLIELHARNCKLIVLMWRPFHRCFACFRRKWDPRSSNITAFSTLISLTLMKIWHSTILLLLPNDTNSHDRFSSLYIDPYITDLRYFYPVALLLALATLVPILILCLYPTKLCKVFCCCQHRPELFRYFVETFQGHYKDGTNGTRDYRAVSSIVFILRISVAIAFHNRHSISNNPAHSSSLVMVYILLIVSLFYSIAQPCKKKYVNDLESIQYGFTGLSFLCVINSDLNPYPRVGRNTGFHVRPALANTMLAVHLLPSFFLLAILVHKIALRRISSVCKSDNNSQEALPDRIVHPNQYTPLLNK